MFAAFIAVCAWITIPVGVIPITLQTFAVFLCAVTLGAKRGTLSVLVYILIGAVGVPVFSGFKGGIGTLLGATGGYIVGFIFSAILTGILSEKFCKYSIIKNVLAMLAGLAVCYLFGTLWFMFVYTKSTEPTHFISVMMKCVVPFILPDIIKISLAAVLGTKLKKVLNNMPE